MTFPDSKTTPQGNLFEECANGDAFALSLATSIYAYIDWLDNAIDRDVVQSAELSAKTSLNLFLALSYNPFWEAHKVRLGALLVAGFNAWLDSEKLRDHADYRFRVTGDVLKGYFMEFFYQVAFITGGYDLMRKVSSKWRGVDFDSKPDGDKAPLVQFPIKEHHLPALEFPKDHGEHPEYAIEWWYLSGTFNMGDDLCGYHICTFRIGERKMTHLSLSTPKGLFQHDMDGGAIFDFSLPGRIVVSAGGENNYATLELKYDRSILLQGKNADGVSIKSDLPNHFSRYYSIPNLRTKGSIMVGGSGIDIEGTSWFDHEFAPLIKPDGFGWVFVYGHFEDGSVVNAYFMIKDKVVDTKLSRVFKVSPAGVRTNIEWVIITAKGDAPSIENPGFVICDKAAGPFITIRAKYQETMKTRLGDYLETPCTVEMDGKTGVGYLEITN